MPFSWGPILFKIVSPPLPIELSVPRCVLVFSIELITAIQNIIIDYLFIPFSYSYEWRIFALFTAVSLLAQNSAWNFVGIQ